MSQTKQKKNSPDPKKQKKFGKSFFVNLVTVIQERVGAIIGICLIVVSIFVAFSMILYFMNETAFKRAFTSPYYILVKLAVIVILIYTMISTADFIINFIMVRLPADIVNDARDEFLLKMNLNVVRYANGNPITAFIIRLFNYVSLSPSIINSPSVNFIMGFISIFGVVFILFFKHVFLWIFNRFIKPIYQPILDRILKKINSRKDKIADEIKEKNIAIQTGLKKGGKKVATVAKKYQQSLKNRPSRNKEDDNSPAAKSKKTPK